MLNKGFIQEIKSEIKEIQKENIEEFFHLSHYSWSQYFMAWFRYGKDSLITQNNKEVFKIYLANLLEEEKYLCLLWKNLRSDLQSSDVLQFLDQLDSSHEKCSHYLYQSLDHLFNAYELDKEYAAKLEPKNFCFLKETDSYRIELVRILLGAHVLENYFQYPSEFWEYIKNRVTLLDDEIENMDFIGVYPKLDGENRLTNIKIFLPRMINIQTLKINVHELNHAYLLYTQLGKVFQELDYEGLAKKEEQNFMENYFTPILKRVFKS